MKSKPGKLLIAEHLTEDFTPFSKILDPLVRKNNRSQWEAHVINFSWQKATGTMEKFEASDTKTLLKTILPEIENQVSIFEFKNNGFAINNINEMNRDGDEWYYVLPACKEEYHRDWERDGICVHDIEKEE